MVSALGVQRFAHAGPVGELSSAQQMTPGPTVNMTNNFYLDAGDLLSEEQVRRKVIPVLNEVLNRSK